MSEMIKMAKPFGELLTRKIDELGISQREFAARAGLCEVTVVRLCMGNHLPNIVLGKVIADALGITLDALVAELDGMDA